MLQFLELVEIATKMRVWIVRFAVYTVLLREGNSQIGFRIGDRTMAVPHRPLRVVDLVELIRSAIGNQRFDIVWLRKLKAPLRKVSDYQGMRCAGPVTLRTAGRLPVLK